MKKIQKIAIVFVTGLVLALLFILVIRQNTEIVNTRENEFAIMSETVMGRQISDEESPAGVITEFVLPLNMDLTAGKVLMFYVSHQWTEVFIGDECVYSLEPSGELSFIKTSGSKWVQIPLYPEDAGKTVRVITTPVYENLIKSEVEFFVGSSFSIYKEQLKSMLPTIILCVVNIVIGILLLFAALYFRREEKEQSELMPLGMLGIVMGFWQLAHNDFSPFLWEGKEIFLYYLSVVMMLVCMIPLVRTVIEKLSGYKKTILQYYLVIVSVMASLQIILQMTGVRDLREMFLFTHGSIIVGAVLVIGVTIIGSIKKHKEHGGKNQMWILAVGLLGDLLLYYMNDTSSGLIMILSAILIYILLEAFCFLSVYFEQKQMIKEKENQLNHSRLVILMSQIRSHFVFNILNAISGMCKYDPEKADETIVRFSRYLRNNIDMMEEDKMIPFDMELQRLEDYILLEQVRFGERLEFVTDIEVTDFMIPSLIIQPVIENSIKHGITKRKSGGAILLSTWKENGNIIISIDDDGVGFDIKELEKSTSVGLKNIRYRLKYLLDGTLTIRSEINKGTKVIISFPEQGRGSECI